MNSVLGSYLKWLLAGMGTHMDYESPTNGEGLVTFGTLEGSLTGMRAHMTGQMVSLGE